MIPMAKSSCAYVDSALLLDKNCMPKGRHIVGRLDFEPGSLGLVNPNVSELPRCRNMPRARINVESSHCESRH